MEVWLPITSFPGYSVSDEGRVRNDRTGRILSICRNSHGIMTVGLSRDLVQHKRSVALLVARAFVPKLAWQQEAFDTPINLDGDRSNNRASNIMWRPHWFAVKYFRQFNNNLRGFDCPIEEVISGLRFENSWQAATMFGLLDVDIMVATMNRTYVWPTHHKFRVLYENRYPSV